MRNVIDIDPDLMERMAFESGREIELRKTHALLRMPAHTYRSSLPLPKIPAQRTGDDR